MYFGAVGSLFGRMMGLTTDRRGAHEFVEFLYGSPCCLKMPAAKLWLFVLI